jgi:hypothetical protein
MSPNPLVRGPLLVACPLLLVNCIRTCPSCVSHQRARLFLMIKTDLSWKDNMRMNLQEYYSGGRGLEWLRLGASCGLFGTWFCLFLSICPGRRLSFPLFNILRRWKFVSMSPNIQVGGPLLFACPLPLIHSICSCPSYVSNQRTRLVLTGTSISRKDNIRMNIQVYYGEGTWTGLAGVRDKLRFLVHAFLNFRVYKTLGSFWQAEYLLAS